MLSALEKAKLHLAGAYAINSLFWTYMNTKGENPKEHGVKDELDRIKNYMGRVKEIEDRLKAPKLDKSASKKFVRNALWQAAHKRSGSSTDTPSKHSKKEDT
ncbi:hypothetical protein LSH36_204g10034 [Paralvinella palmiformis]|uniref:Nuclear nucleic acid-binding protein C1D n=1 Tax=Paralvinella palmiformis TaxID=53620 RepID=A0AAD9JQQ1_9ANNE|nr:hypothetical protein LSH36_204g10034 [Paralvinella palmiformis]